MRNAILPPVSPQFYNLGNSEAQLPNMEFPFDHNLSSYYLESKVFNDGNQIRSGGGFQIPCQSIINFQPGNSVAGYQSTSTGCSKNISKQSMFPSSSSVPGVEMGSEGIQRKRPFDLVENKAGSFLSEWKKNKRKKATFSEQFQDHRLQMPVRRSQKLSDKITALQKLVSPYGKTDTASVLQEASVYIKLLQEQIKNLFDMLSTPYNKNEIDGKLLELQRRGLCLVPVNLMQKMTQQDCFPPNTCSTKTRNFQN